MSCVAVAANVCGLVGAVLLAFSFKPFMSGKRKPDGKRKNWIEEWKWDRGWYRQAKGGQIPFGYMHLFRERFYPGLFLIGLSYVLPFFAPLP